jgi:Aldo/keto reductase family
VWRCWSSAAERSRKLAGHNETTAARTRDPDRRVDPPQRRRRGSILRYVRLGQTDLKVSAIAFGTWAFGGDWGAADRHDSDAAIGRALELGINLFDTAQGYGFGVAEQFLAEALRRRVRREEVVIATKGGLRMQDGSLLRDASAGWLRQGVEASLRSLGTDYLDLYQLHWPDPHTPAAEIGWADFQSAAIRRSGGAGRWSAAPSRFAGRRGSPSTRRHRPLPNRRPPPPRGRAGGADRPPRPAGTTSWCRGRSRCAGCVAG